MQLCTCDLNRPAAAAGHGLCAHRDRCLPHHKTRTRALDTFNQVGRNLGNGGVLGLTDISFLRFGDGDFGESVWVDLCYPMVRKTLCKATGSSTLCSY